MSSSVAVSKRSVRSGNVCSPKSSAAKEASRSVAPQTFTLAAARSTPGGTDARSRLVRASATGYCPFRCHRVCMTRLT